MNVAHQPRPTKRCPPTAFASNVEAKAARRNLVKRSIFSHVEYCETCDLYHLRVKVNESLSKQEYEILTLVAQGFTLEEMAKETGLSYNAVRDNLDRMCRRFDAVNRTNLTAITVQLGVLDCTPFMPGLGERNHA